MSPPMPPCAFRNRFNKPRGGGSPCRIANGDPSGPKAVNGSGPDSPGTVTPSLVRAAATYALKTRHGSPCQ